MFGLSGISDRGHWFSVALLLIGSGLSVSQTTADDALCGCTAAAACDCGCSTSWGHGCDESGCDGLGTTTCDRDGCMFCDALEACPLCQSIATIRKSFADCGITMQNNVTQFYMGNTSGGLDQDFRYARHGDYVMNFDFGKMGVQEGLFLKLRAEHRMGETISDITGSLLPATIAGDLPVNDSEHVYLTNVLLTQALSENFVLFAGKMDTLDGDMNAFAHGRGIRQFSNMAFVSAPVALRTVPYSTLGAGFAILDEGEPLFTFLVLNATDTTRTSGISDLFNDGVVLSAELRLPTNFFDLPGHQLIGGTWSSREYVSIGQDPRVVLPDVPIDRQSGSWSIYWNCDQYLVSSKSNPKQGWGYFARAGIADQDTNPLGYFLSAGLGGTSPLAGRQGDSFGVGYYYSGTSDRVGQLLTAALGPIDDGQGMELFYNVALTKAVTITPDFQVLSSPRESLDSAVVTGVRMNVVF